MNKTEKLLQTSYQSAKLGASSINALLPSVTDEKMRSYLLREMEEYDMLSEEAESELVYMGSMPKDRNPVSQAMADFMVRIKAGMNKSTSHIAEMMAGGANMGIIEMTKAKNDAPDATAESNRIAGEILKLSQRTVDEMKPFL